MKKIKNFLKNVKDEYLLIDETRSKCPHVIKFEKWFTYGWFILILLISLIGVGISASAEETTPIEPRTTTVSSGTYEINHQGTIPSSIGYFEIDCLYFALGDTYESGVNAPWGRIKWNLGTQTLSLFTYPNYEELVVYKEGEWLSRECFCIFIPNNTNVLNDQYATRFLQLFTRSYSGSTAFNYTSDGYNYGLTDGYDTYYELGYDRGFEDGVESANPFSNIIVSVLDGVDHFVIFGDFSILDLIKAIMGIFLAVWLLKLFAGG